MSKLNNEMKNLERLEKERREMLSKMDIMSSEQQSKKSSMDMSKNVGDLNMKLKMEIGALRGENEGLAKKHDEVIKEIKTLEDQIQVKIQCQCPSKQFLSVRLISLRVTAEYLPEL